MERDGGFTGLVKGLEWYAMEQVRPTEAVQRELAEEGSAKGGIEEIVGGTIVEVAERTFEFDRRDAEG